MLNTEWTQVEVLELLDQFGTASGAACFGFSILGGKSTGVVIKSITPGSISDLDGRLHCGDHVLYVGTICVRGLSAEQVAAVLRQQTNGYLQLIVARQVASPQTPASAALVRDATLSQSRTRPFSFVTEDDVSHSHFRSGPSGYCSSKAPIILTSQLDEYLNMLLSRSAERDMEDHESVVAADDCRTPHDDEREHNTNAGGAQCVPTDAGAGSPCTNMPIHLQLVDTDRSDRLLQPLVLANANLSIMNESQTDEPSKIHQAMDIHDHIPSINGTGKDTEHTNHRKTWSPPVTPTEKLRIDRAESRESDSTDIIDVDLRLTKNDAGYGIRVAGYFGHVDGIDLCGIFVKSLVSRSPAARDGRIRVNDQLIGVNGASLTGVSNHVALQMLRNSGHFVRLRLARHNRGPIFEQLAKLADNTPPLLADGVEVIPKQQSAQFTSKQANTLLEKQNGNLIEPISDHNAIENGSQAALNEHFQSPVSKKTKHDVLMYDYTNQCPTTSEPMVQLASASAEYPDVAYWRKMLGLLTEFIAVDLTVCQQDIPHFSNGERCQRTTVNLLGCKIQTAVIRDHASARSSKSQPLHRTKRHFIIALMPAGPIARDGRLRIGDEILEINGRATYGHDLHFVLAMLSDLNREVHLLCARHRRTPSFIGAHDDASTTDGNSTQLDGSSDFYGSADSDSTTDSGLFAKPTAEGRSSGIAWRRRRVLVSAAQRSAAIFSRLQRGTAVNDRRHVYYGRLSNHEFAGYDEDSEDEDSGSLTPTASQSRGCTAPRGDLPALNGDTNRVDIARSRLRLFGTVKSKSDTNLVVASAVRHDAWSTHILSNCTPSCARRAQFSSTVTNKQQVAASDSNTQHSIRFRKEDGRTIRTRIRSGDASLPNTTYFSSSSRDYSGNCKQHSYVNLSPFELTTRPPYRCQSLQSLIGMALWTRDPSVIELQRPGANVGLGFSVAEHSDPFNPLKPVIVIRSLVPGGIADIDGRLTPGDRLLFVNQVQLDRLGSFAEVLHALRSIPPGTVRIGFAKPLPLAILSNTEHQLSLPSAPVVHRKRADVSFRVCDANESQSGMRSSAKAEYIDGTKACRYTLKPLGANSTKQSVLLTNETTSFILEQYLPAPPVDLLKSPSGSDDLPQICPVNTTAICDKRDCCSQSEINHDETQQSVALDCRSTSKNTLFHLPTNNGSVVGSKQLRFPEPPPLEITDSDVECLEKLSCPASSHHPSTFAVPYNDSSAAQTVKSSRALC